MNPKPDKPEPYLMAKELSYRLCELGIEHTDDYVRACLRAMPPMMAPRHKHARWSDFWTWYCLNPDFMPFSRDPARRGAGKTRGLLEPR